MASTDSGTTSIVETSNEGCNTSVYIRIRLFHEIQCIHSRTLLIPDTRNVGCGTVSSLGEYIKTDACINSRIGRDVN